MATDAVIIRVLPFVMPTPHARTARVAAQGALRPLEDAIDDPEVLDWYHLTPAERWGESERLWATYLTLEGSLDPEPDLQSPFYDPLAPSRRAPHGRPGMHPLRRGGV